jgi:hypothetical protein
MPTIDELLAEFNKAQQEEFSPKKKIIYKEFDEGGGGGMPHNPFKEPGVGSGFGSQSAKGGFGGGSGKKTISEEINVIDPDYGRLATLGSKTRNSIAQEIQNRENQAKDTLVKRRDETNSAIDNELRNLLEQSGVQANLAREETGEQFAGRGLLRSTATTRGIDQINSQEQGLRAQSQLASALQKDKVNTVVNESFAQIERAKEERKIRKGLADIQKAEEFRSVADLGDFERQYKTELFNLNLEQKELEQTNALFGSIFGTAAKLLFLA